MRTDFLSFSPPCLSEDEIAAVTAVLREGAWLSSGPRTKQFEENFQKTVAAPAALALNSATAGLHLGMLVHNVGPGDEVLTTPLTFCATANVVEHVGGTVRLADIDPETLLISPDEIEKILTKKTKVIVPVHYAGHPCDMNRIDELAKNNDSFVVEDAAHCMPSKIGGEWVGHSDNLTAFSFYATKNITTGEGGMLTGRTDWIDRARVLALHGMSRGAWNRFAKGASWKYDVPEPGFKYNMTDVAAAMGVVQLARLDELYKRRMKIVDIYRKEFASSPYLQTLKVLPGYQTSWHLFLILLNLETLKITRDEFIDQLQAANIGCSVHYRPIHMMSFYAKKYGWTPESFPHASRAFERMISIPLSSKMNEKDAFDVVEAVTAICKKNAR
jgi:dTDP-4-amino-4,6-dideoxygalactose transaminase